ncbi:MAG: hypothetical protein AABZ74_13765 [Cyanobacteriota bacterium]
MKKFNPYEKPPFICPKEYCFNWEKTSCSANQCKRLDEKSNIDALEPNEIKMAEDGLPWFYFTHIDNIVEVMRNKYYIDSNKYWGNNS